MEVDRFHRWHDAERAVRDLEQRLLLARLPRAATPAAVLLDLEQRLAAARSAADRSLSDCLRNLARRGRRQRVPAGHSGSSTGDSA